MNLTDLPKKY